MTREAEILSEYPLAERMPPYVGYHIIESFSCSEPKRANQPHLNADRIVVRPDLGYILVADGAGSGPLPQSAAEIAIRSYASALNNKHDYVEASIEATRAALNAGYDWSIAGIMDHVDSLLASNQVALKNTSIMTTITAGQLVTNSQGQLCAIGSYAGDSPFYIFSDKGLIFRSSPEDWLDRNRQAGNYTAAQYATLRNWQLESRPTGDIYVNPDGAGVHAEDKLPQSISYRKIAALDGRYLSNALNDPRFERLGGLSESAYYGLNATERGSKSLELMKPIINGPTEFVVPIVGNTIVCAAFSDGIGYHRESAIMRIFEQIVEGKMSLTDGLSWLIGQAAQSETDDITGGGFLIQKK